ncbi:MAG: rRNA maturation RNase YbeY [Dehalococcoidales bacterium]|nr:rRNA maturation RNase YbeY [Dehalococcoidales bacterium]
MEVNISIAEEFKGKVTRRWLRDIAEQVLKSEKTGTNVEMGVLITNQENIRTLNMTYRDLNEPTDVLSFYMIPESEQNDDMFIMPPDNVKHIGEVVISYPQARKQAEENKHTVKKEITVLLIHGVLHLLGYDHEEPADERKMKSREKAILDSVGDGY